MNRIKTIFMAVAAVMLMGITAKPAMAQNVVDVTDLVGRITEESGGDIEISIPEDMMEDLSAQPSKGKKPAQVIRPGINKSNGYRIQVFGDGRGQSSLEARAKARGRAIVAKFPKYRGQVYTFSSSPNWYTRVGNFVTQAEANTALAELKRAFPQFASEMRIVRSKITVIK